MATWDLMRHGAPELSTRHRQMWPLEAPVNRVRPSEVMAAAVILWEGGLARKRQRHNAHGRLRPAVAAHPDHRVSGTTSSILPDLHTHSHAIAHPEALGRRRKPTNAYSALNCSIFAFWKATLTPRARLQWVPRGLPWAHSPRRMTVVAATTVRCCGRHWDVLV